MKLRKKPSKRMPARKRYKIAKKIREHNRKIKKEAKEHLKKKPKIMHVPNKCPFKEDILKEGEAMRKHQKEEKQKQKKAAHEKKCEELIKTDLQGLINQAEAK